MLKIFASWRIPVAFQWQNVLRDDNSRDNRLEKSWKYQDRVRALNWVPSYHITSNADATANYSLSKQEFSMFRWAECSESKNNQILLWVALLECATLTWPN